MTVKSVQYTKSSPVEYQHKNIAFFVFVILPSQNQTTSIAALCKCGGHSNNVANETYKNSLLELSSPAEKYKMSLQAQSCQYNSQVRSASYDLASQLATLTTLCMDLTQLWHYDKL